MAWLTAWRVRRIEEHGMHGAFEISIILKGLNAVLEIILGAVLFFTAKHADVFVALVQNELVDDPYGFLSRHASTVLAYLNPQVQEFASLYLLAHGIVKVSLIAGLLRNKLWAYPAAIAIFTLFVIYQCFRISQHHSVPLMVLTVFDVAVIALISHEYHHRLKVLRIPPTA